MQTSYCDAPNLAHPARAAQTVPAEWFAVQTRPRHEKVLASHLQTSGVEAFLPLCPQVRTWSDRRKIVEFPLFPGYVFVFTPWLSPARARILESNGALGFVGPRNRATPIPAEQIEAVRSLIQAKAEYRPHHYLIAGQRVRIRDGALQGLQGILVSVSNDDSLVIPVDLIHRSVAVQLKGYEVEPL
jgi:transcription antitermination factor NusG